MAPTMATIAAWMLLGIRSVQADMYLNSWGLGTGKISRARIHRDMTKMMLTITTELSLRCLNYSSIHSPVPP